MGLASRIGTYMGPFQGFGPNWDQVPNLGHHYEHCSCYLDFFFSETKFSETETETFFRDQIFSKPKPILFFRNQIFRNRNPQRFGKSFETEKFRNRNVNLWLKRLKRRGIVENFSCSCQREELYISYFTRKRAFNVP